jgi:dTDP-glucose pyrophosphorylase
MNFTLDERIKYIRPINQNGGSINTKTKVVDVTKIQRGNNGFPNDVKIAIDFFHDEGFTVRHGDIIIQQR